MRVLPTVLISAFLGCAIGGAMAYISIGPAKQSGGTLVGSNPTASINSNASLPLLESDELTFNFGTMQKGTTKTHVFKFTNRGTAPLTLTAGAPTCSCTLVDLSDTALTEGQLAADKPIPPGAETGVKLKWTGKAAGPFRHSVKLFTNDPRSPNVELSVEGDVTEVTGLNPSTFAFDKIRAGEAKTASVELVSFGDTPLEIKDSLIKPEDQGEYFDIKVIPLSAEELATSKAKSGVRVELTNNSLLPLGMLSQSVVVKTNMPDWEELEIGIVGRVVGDITIHGRAWVEQLGVVQLGIIDSKKGAEAKLLISTKGKQADDIQFEVAEVDPPQLKVTIGTSKIVKPGVRHTDLIIAVPPGTPPMIHLDTAEGKQGQITLKSNHPQTPQLVVPVRFAVER